MSWAFDQGDEVIALRRECDSLRSQLAEVDLKRYCPDCDCVTGFFDHDDGGIWETCKTCNRVFAYGERESLVASVRTQLAERDATIASLRNRIADNLCYLKPDEKFDPMLPKPIHLESCERFYDQEVGKRGVLEGCMTVAQLKEKLDKSEAEVRALLTKHAAEHSRAFVAEQKLAEAERERDEQRRRYKDELAALHDTRRDLERLLDLATAQVERLRNYASRAEMACSFPSDDFQKAMRDEARKVLAETPEQSLAAVREQARRKALESLPHYPGCGRLPCSLCVALAAQPAEAEV